MTFSVATQQMLSLRWVSLTTASSRQPKTSSHTQRHMQVTRCAASGPQGPQGPLRPTDRAPFIPQAPPPAFTPPPIPPPPPPSTGGQLKFPRFSRRGLLAIMMGGAFVNVLWRNRDVPAMFPVPNNPQGTGVCSSYIDTVPSLRYVAVPSMHAMVVRTKGGEPVVVSFDQTERMYIFDLQGNLYYDTGDERFGWNVVTANDEVWNYRAVGGGFSPGPEDIKKTFLGYTKEMVDVPITDIGGIPIQDLQKSFERYGLKSEGNMMTFFRDPTRPQDRVQEYPPGAPYDLFAWPSQNPKFEYQGVEMFSPLLEEGEIVLQQQKESSGWLFGGKQVKRSPTEVLSTLKRCDGFNCNFEAGDILNDSSKGK